MATPSLVRALVFLAALASVLALDCPQLEFGRKWANTCWGSDKSRPMCRIRAADPLAFPPVIAGGQCSECLTDCDCNPGKYCSNDPTVFGTCQSFKSEGKSCLPYSNEDLLTNPIETGKYKCVDYSADYRNITYLGSCVAGVCRMCAATSLPSPDNPLASSSRSWVSCQQASYGEIPRFCQWPGTYVSLSNMNWDNTYYSQDPFGVWMAVFMVFFSISLTMCCGTLAADIYNGMRGGNSRTPKNKEEESHTSSVQMTAAAPASSPAPPYASQAPVPAYVVPSSYPPAYPAQGPPPAQSSGPAQNQAYGQVDGSGSAAQWIEDFTADGKVYFYNPSTGETKWEKPF